MKKIFIGVMAALAVTSCKTDNSDHPHIDIKAAEVASVTPMSVNQLLLSKEMSTANVTFNWKAADYGYKAAIKYIVQADVSGGDFSSAVELAVADGIMGQIPIEKLNGILVNKFKFEPAKEGEPAKVYKFDIRIASYISQNIEKIYSTPSPIFVVTYQDNIVYPSMGVPGNYAFGTGAENWNPGNMLTRVWDTKLNGTYVGYISMNQTGNNNPLEFKFVDGDAWGAPELVSGTPTLKDGSYLAEFEDGKEGNILGAPKGYYQITVNINTTPKTLAMFPITSLGITGSATTPEWSDTGALPLTYNLESAVWEGKNLTLKDGEFLILVNNNWGSKFGLGEGGAGTLLYSGSAANIPGPGAGTYDLVVNLTGSTLTYTFVAK